MPFKLPQLMGIVNVTPDSFSDGGQFMPVEVAVRHGLQLLEQGADILDIGGESTRPQAEVIEVEEECARILPVITQLKKYNARISVDTRNAITMRRALDCGADIINDISGLTYDAGSLSVAATANCPVVLMHMRGTPQTMQQLTDYNDVVADVYNDLENIAATAIKAGVARHNITLDVGIGFAKTAEQNLKLLHHLAQFKKLGFPLLLGASRKSFIGLTDGGAAANQRLGGSIAAALYAAQNGADILRVHDVFETRQALKIHAAISMA